MALVCVMWPCWGDGKSGMFSAACVPCVPSQDTGTALRALTRTSCSCVPWEALPNTAPMLPEAHYGTLLELRHCCEVLLPPDVILYLKVKMHQRRSLACYPPTWLLSEARFCPTPVGSAVQQSPAPEQSCPSCHPWEELHAWRVLTLGGIDCKFLKITCGWGSKVNILPVHWMFSLHWPCDWPQVIVRRCPSMLDVMDGKIIL